MIRPLLLTLALLAPPAVAQEGAIRQLDLSAMELAAHPLFTGVEAAFLTGAFDAEGLYAANSVMQRGSTFPPHAHPDLRLTVVISGTMYLGEGAEIRPEEARPYPAGTIALTPPGTMHYMLALEDDVRILEIGSGPSGSDFAQDPS